MLNNDDIVIKFLGKKSETPLLHNRSSKVWKANANAMLHLNYCFATLFVRHPKKFHLVNGWSCHEHSDIAGWNFDHAFMDYEPETMTYKHLMKDPKSETEGTSYYFDITIKVVGPLRMMDIATHLRDRIEII